MSKQYLSQICIYPLLLRNHSKVLLLLTYSFTHTVGIQSRSQLAQSLQTRCLSPNRMFEVPVTAVEKTKSLRKLRRSNCEVVGQIAEKTSELAHIQLPELSREHQPSCPSKYLPGCCINLTPRREN